jgi:hypothetical protein
MMRLNGGDSWFELAILGYQFPKIKNDAWDSNWLIIEGHVSLSGRDWHFRDSCLTTFEVLQLAQWLDAVATGSAAAASCGFTEPNLQFERQSASTIRVSFALESAPPWAHPDDDWEKHGFEIPISPMLAIAAEQLRKQLVPFPERARD